MVRKMPILAPIWTLNGSKSAVTIFAVFRTQFSRNFFHKNIFCISRNFAKVATLPSSKKKKGTTVLRQLKNRSGNKVAYLYVKKVL